MGCSSSKQVGAGGAGQPANRIVVSGPVDPPGMVPRAYRDADGVPMVPEEHDLSRENITQALGHVASYLQAHGKNLLLVTVGGAVNTVLLRTRQSTHDVDFFNPAYSSSELSLLRAASRYAQQQSPSPLGGKWLNNETGTIGGTSENIPQLIDQARQQGTVVFQAPGLTVLAAPWLYAFVAKIGRMTYGTGRPYDAADAVAYLHQYSQRHGGKPVPASAIREWGRQYRRVTPNEILEQVNHLYQQTYGRPGIIIN